MHHNMELSHTTLRFLKFQIDVPNNVKLNKIFLKSIKAVNLRVHEGAEPHDQSLKYSLTVRPTHWTFLFNFFVVCTCIIIYYSKST